MINWILTIPTLLINLNIIHDTLFSGNSINQTTEFIKSKSEIFVYLDWMFPFYCFYEKSIPELLIIMDYSPIILLANFEEVYLWI